MNYEDMSDLTIDRKVFVRIYGECIGDKDMERVWRDGKFRPCNNPSNAWPIITENHINLSKHKDDNEWFAFTRADDLGVSEFQCKDKNQLKAAMICFLKMKDAEK